MQITRDFLESQKKAFETDRQNSVNLIVKADAGIELVDHLLGMLDKPESEDKAAENAPHPAE